MERHHHDAENPYHGVGTPVPPSSSLATAAARDENNYYNNNSCSSNSPSETRLLLLQEAASCLRDVSALSNMGVSSMVHGNYRCAMNIFKDALAILHILFEGKQQSRSLIPSATTAATGATTTTSTTIRQDNRQHKLQVAASALSQISTLTATKKVTVANSISTNVVVIDCHDTASLLNSALEGVVKNGHHCGLSPRYGWSPSTTTNSTFPIFMIREPWYVGLNDRDNHQDYHHQEKRQQQGEMESGILLYNYGVACFLLYEQLQQQEKLVPIDQQHDHQQTLLYRRGAALEFQTMLLGMAEQFWSWSHQVFVHRRFRTSLVEGHEQTRPRHSDPQQRQESQQHPDDPETLLQGGCLCWQNKNNDNDHDLECCAISLVVLSARVHCRQEQQQQQTKNAGNSRNDEDGRIHFQNPGSTSSSTTMAASWFSSDYCKLDPDMPELQRKLEDAHRVLVLDRVEGGKAAAA
ncbi:hypothetical protein ACA910_020275 [Epithemia clementina (nom. ined.)]